MTSSITSMADREIVNTRIVKASAETVFAAWTDPNHLKNWWGPKGFTNTFHEFDMRPGGRWIFTMHGPDKGHYQNDVEFIQIIKPSLIYWKRHSQPHFQILATFEEVAHHKTKIVFKMIFASAAERDKLIKYVPEKNEENLDRLESELAIMSE